MKVILVNGSPRKQGNTNRALAEVAAQLEKGGIETEVFWVGNRAMQGCTACGKCHELGRCIFKDEPYEKLLALLEQADGLVIGSPTYYAAPAGSLCALLDRVFYSCGPLLKHKVGTAVAVCRRGGASANLDRLNKYFTISNMPVVPSQYWNLIHGRLPGEVEQDAEGLQTLRTLGQNMVWMLKSLNRDTAPELEAGVMTSFVR